MHLKVYCFVLVLTCLIVWPDHASGQTPEDCAPDLVHSAYADHSLSGVSVPWPIPNAVIISLNPSPVSDLRTRWVSREAKIRVCQGANCSRQLANLRMPPVTGYIFDEPIFLFRRANLPVSPGWITIEIREILRGFNEDGSVKIYGCPMQSYVISI